MRVWYWIGSAWVKRGQDLDGDDPQKGTGRSVKLSERGDVVVVGNPRASVPFPGTVFTRVYEWTGSAWAQRGSDIVEVGTNFRLFFALATDFDGDCIAVGDDNAGGAVRVYDFDGTDWAQRGVDIAPGLAVESVSVNWDCNTVAIGAPSSSSDRGSAMVYDWTGTAWSPRGASFDGAEPGGVLYSYYYGDQAGGNVALSASGGVLAVMYLGADGGGSMANTGTVRVFEYPVPTLPPTPAPSATPTVISTALPTAAPTDWEIVIETSHPYLDDVEHVWTAQRPGVTCYKITMDPRSWTPEKYDFAAIFAVNGGMRTKLGHPLRLYRARLREFGVVNVVADSIEVVFKSDFVSRKHYVRESRPDRDAEKYGLRLVVSQGICSS